MTTTASQDTNEYNIYEKVASDVTRSVVGAYLGLGVIWFVARLSPTVARWLFWAAFVLGILGVIHLVVVLTAGTIGGLLRLGRKWLLAAAVARVVELILSLTALWLAARVVGYSP
jgi:hypothetical protein